MYLICKLKKILLFIKLFFVPFFQHIRVWDGHLSDGVSGAHDRHSQYLICLVTSPFVWATGPSCQISGRMRRWGTSRRSTWNRLLHNRRGSDAQTETQDVLDSCDSCSSQQLYGNWRSSHSPFNLGPPRRSSTTAAYTPIHIDQHFHLRSDRIRCGC